MKYALTSRPSAQRAEWDTVATVDIARAAGGAGHRRRAGQPNQIFLAMNLPVGVEPSICHNARKQRSQTKLLPGFEPRMDHFGVRRGLQLDTVIERLMRTRDAQFCLQYLEICASHSSICADGGVAQVVYT